LGVEGGGGGGGGRSTNYRENSKGEDAMCGSVLQCVAV